MLAMMLAMMFRDDKTNGPTAIMKMLFRFLNIAQYEDKKTEWTTSAALEQFAHSRVRTLTQRTNTRTHSGTDNHTYNGRVRAQNK